MASRYVWYACLVPPLLAATYVLASSPIVPKQLPAPVDPGLASLPLNSRARVIYPEDFMEGGAYVQLPMGRVRYWLIGPPSGKKIVLIHGIRIPALAFTRIAPILAEAGYRVLLYDLYGRGYSDVPQDAVYDPQLYVVQLALLLQHLHWTRVRLVGFSMGGAIAASFVAAFPALVERDVVLIASAGAGGPDPSWLSKLRHWSFVEWRVKRKLATRVSLNESPLQEIVRLQAEHLRGYPRAIISSFHDGIITKLDWAFSSSAWRGRRVLLLNGDRDTVVPPAAAQGLRKMLDSASPATSESDKSEDAPPDVLLVPVLGAEHDLTWMHPTEVTRAILEFWDAGKVPVPYAVPRYPHRQPGDGGGEDAGEVPMPSAAPLNPQRQPRRYKTGRAANEVGNADGRGESTQ
ncbi:Alpha/Beta hydrolase protein [Mycena galopus ATCC 62051]|nr:Alpha/Beta hydrolase protein [Mycena galopus ATCC 62051]